MPLLVPVISTMVGAITCWNRKERDVENGGSVEEWCSLLLGSQLTNIRESGVSIAKIPQSAASCLVIKQVQITRSRFMGIQTAY
jgi:hypothetical protein